MFPIVALARRKKNPGVTREGFVKAITWQDDGLVYPVHTLFILADFLCTSAQWDQIEKKSKSQWVGLFIFNSFRTNMSYIFFANIILLNLVPLCISRILYYIILSFQIHFSLLLLVLL